MKPLLFALLCSLLFIKVKLRRKQQLFIVKSTMIRFFLLQNRQGKTRLSKWYATAPEDSERIKIEADIHRVVSLRARGNTNFIEVWQEQPIRQQYLFYGWSLCLDRFLHVPFSLKILPFVQYRNFKLIYRRYAGLFFVYGVDITDNELLLMETVHLFVELLDEFFSNVCEVSGFDLPIRNGRLE